MKPTLMAKKPTLNLMLLFVIVLSFFVSCNKEEIFLDQGFVQEEEIPSEEEEIGDNEFVVQLQDDFFTTPENTPLEIDLNSNDGEIPSNAVFSYSDPSNGALVIDKGIIEYTPNTDFVGDDTFEYRVCDAETGLTCFTANVTITVTEVIEDDVAAVLKAFPTAEGAGANASGGRGGVVLHVTNLNNSGPGSFRDALVTADKTMPRTIVFDVSGTIVLDWDINTSGLKNFTIAGQTAPEGGITIECPKFAIARAENAIIRYIRIVNTTYFHSRKKSTAINLAGANNVIMDHVSIRYTWASPGFNFQDDNDTNNGQGEMTIQRSLIGDCLTGGIVGGVVQYPRAAMAGSNSVHHNLFAHVDHRFPNVAGDAQAEVVENVVYNYRARLNVFFNNSETNMENNTFKAGPSSSFYAARNKIGQYVGGDIKVYTSGNRIVNDSGNSLEPSDTDWNSLFVVWASSLNQANEITPADETRYRSGAPFADLGVPITKLGTEAAYTSVLDDVGANKYLNADGSVGKYLDLQDQRYIDDTNNGTLWNGGTSHVNKTDQNALVYPVLPQNTRPADYDSDGDGMADVWERAAFGDLSRDGKGDFDGDGYTDAEEFWNLVDKS